MTRHIHDDTLKQQQEGGCSEGHTWPNSGLNPLNTPKEAQYIVQRWADSKPTNKAAMDAEGMHRMGRSAKTDLKEQCPPANKSYNV